MYVTGKHLCKVYNILLKKAFGACALQICGADAEVHLSASARVIDVDLAMDGAK